MSKNKKTFFAICFFILNLILSSNIILSASSSTSEIFLEELGFSKIIKIQHPRGRDRRNENLDETALPKELLKIIFNFYVSNLRPVAVLNYEWHDWAQPSIINYYHFYKKFLNYKNLDYIHIIFNSGIAEINYYNRIRNVISLFLTEFKLSEQPVVRENQAQFLNLSMKYECKDTKFNFSKLVRSYTQYQSYEEAIKIINIMWESQNYLTFSLDKASNIDWFNKLHKEKTCKFKSLDYTTCLDFICESYFSYCAKFLGNVQFKDKLGRTLVDLIELDKLTLSENNLSNSYYNNYPSLQVMQIFQHVEVDLDQNTPEIRENKLKVLRQEIVECAQEYFIPAEVYIKFIQRQLSLG